MRLLGESLLLDDLYVNYVLPLESGQNVVSFIIQRESSYLQAKSDIEPFISTIGGRGGLQTMYLLYRSVHPIATTARIDKSFAPDGFFGACLSEKIDDRRYYYSIKL